MNRSKPTHPLLPPRERGTGRAFALALLMHVLLGFFLYHGIHWQNSTPAGAEAELWSEVPEQPAPTPAPPPPAAVAPAPPIDQEQADIALQEKKREQQEAAARAALLAEQQRQQQLAEQEAQAQRQRALEQQQAALAAQKAAAAAAAAKLKQQQQLQQQHAEQLRQQLVEQQKLAQEKQEQQQLEAQKKAAAEKAAKAQALAEQQARQKQLDQERQTRLAQLQGLAGESSTGQGLAKSGTGSGSGGTATSPGYADKVKRRVRPNIVWAGETQGLETVIEVHCAPTGTLLSATIERSSGNSQWDDAALRAVQKSDPMPLDENGKTPGSFKITMRPAG
jgi:colicin import membrane protein